MTELFSRMTGRRPWQLQIANRQIHGQGLPREVWRDVFHYCMTISWPRLLAWYGVFYLLINLVFWGFYLAVDGAVTGAQPPRPIDLLFFSFHVFGTASFGGFLAGNLYGEAIVTIEIVVGISCYAVMTGLAFARFTRPQAQILFARNPIVAPHGGYQALSIRIANTRHNFMSDAVAKIWMVAADPVDMQRSKSPVRRFERLALIRDDNPLFALSWNLYHVIDESSPLHGQTAEELARRDAIFAVIVSGHDEDYAQEVRGRYVYHCTDLRWGHAYVNIFNDMGPGQVFVDYTRFHDTAPFSSSPAAGP